MTMRRKALLAASLSAALAGCVSDTGRIDGVTSGVGNAIAANTAMQVVDPWPQGVQDTDLGVPAERTSVVKAAGASSASGDN